MSNHRRQRHPAPVRRAGRRSGAVAACLGLLAAGLGILVGSAPPAAATHYRATQLSWQQVSGNSVDFTATASWRCNFFGLDCDSTPSPAGTTFGAVPIRFGDATSSDATWTVVSIDHVNNVVTASKRATRTYASAGPFTAFIEDCCRLSAPLHKNNPDWPIRVETVVDLARTSASPVSSIPPIVDCGMNALCSFTIPASDPDGQALRFRYATSLEAAGGSTGFAQPGPPHAPTSATVSPGGLYQWNTTGAAVNGSGDTYYSTQVMVENVDGLGAVVSKTAVDFFIRLTTSPNRPPVFNPPTPADGSTFTIPAGQPFGFGVDAGDPDTGNAVTLGIVGQPSGSSFTPTAGNPATGTFSWTPTVAGTFVMNLTAQDQAGLGALPRSITINVTNLNRVPTSDAGTGYSGAEGSAITVAGSAGDPDGDPVTHTWSVAGAAGNDAGASCAIADPGLLATTVTCDDDGVYTLTLAVGDGNGGTASSTAALTVSNVAPAVGITAPVEGALYPIGATVGVTAPVTDAGTNDVAACSVDWDDGAGAVAAGSATGGTCSASRSFTAAGVYTIAMTADDLDGGTATDAVMVVVYDPSAGFVTGGGSIHSPAGAYTADPAVVGKANFGFVSKYKKGAAVPEGQTEFVFHAGGLNLHSTAYEWLVVSGPKAQFKGVATVNGVAGHGFLVTVTDGQVAGGGGADQFRIKVWNAGGIVYDNASSGGDDLNTSAVQSIDGGSIVIHTGGKR